MLGMAVENVRFKDAHDLDLIYIIKPSFATCIRMPSMRPLSLEVRPTAAQLINKSVFYAERLCNSSALFS